MMVDRPQTDADDLVIVSGIPMTRERADRISAHLRGCALQFAAQAVRDGKLTVDEAADRLARYQTDTPAA